MPTLNLSTAKRPLARWASASAVSAMLLSSTAISALANEAVADLVEKVAPSVVTIVVEHDARPASDQAGNIPGLDNSPFGEFFRRFGAPDGMQKNFRNPAPQRALGSGFILDPDGWIVTNNHVVEDGDSVTVRLNDGREFQAEVKGTDKQTDLALLHITVDEALPYVTLGNSDQIRVGEDVVAVGNPFGLGGTVTTGIVSAKGRNIGEGAYSEFIQTDAAINKGNSGGPLFDMDGEVIGVNSAIFSPSGGSVGIGFAVSSNIVSTIVADLRDDGHVNRGWLGVSIQNITPDIAAAMGLNDRKGALVADVLSDSPSDGVLRSGDVIIAFNGDKVSSSDELPKLVAAAKAGEDATVKVIRNGAEKTLKVKIGSFEAAQTTTGTPDHQSASAKVLGVTIAPLSETARAETGVGEDVQGVVVTSIANNGAAARAGLQVGDVIVRLGDQQITSPQSLKDALAKTDGNRVLVLVNRGGHQLFLAVPFA